jgi:hypothetical protein
MFEHYLLILRRRCTNDAWYISCVLCQLAAPGTHAIYKVREAPPEYEQVMLETGKGP